MRYLFSALFTLLPVISLPAIQQELPKSEAPSLKDPKEIIDLQLNSLDHLIAMNKKSVEKMTQIRGMIANYQKIQLLYLENPRDKALLYRMSKLASQLLHEIKDSSLTHAFDSEFINELQLLDRIYKKNELPKI